MVEYFCKIRADWDCNIRIICSCARSLNRESSFNTMAAQYAKSSAFLSFWTLIGHFEGNTSTAKNHEILRNSTNADKDIVDC
ncbi:hypothetical protein TNCV_1075091 [Trichonephila clavipes]|uniref:Uncharacterized protein n=1 Tax=Trichonephila clavipes TaxID=2585209 RepID=A0A8X6SPY4_TRICX|nr:hypothetical protein TNCV_1075091 [Trichonephila clavipes]